MYPIKLSTNRLRILLKHIANEGLRYVPYPAYDILGPGGGVYITSHTPLTGKHLDWVENRNPTAGGQAYIEVTFGQHGETAPIAWVDETIKQSAEPELLSEAREKQKVREESAQNSAKQVATTAKQVATKAEKIYEIVGGIDFTAADLREADVAESMREFERSFGNLHEAVKMALDEYLDGNTLVMDLIFKFQLDKPTVQHALRVASFATEMAAQLAMSDSNDDNYMRTYFGELSALEVCILLGKSQSHVDSLDDAGIRNAYYELFRDELIEIFLGGFMHDCGMWNAPHYLQEAHEIKGAKLISETVEVQRFVPSLIKTVLFHSDITRLAKEHGAVEITESPDDPNKKSFHREFYSSLADAHSAIELRHGDFRADVLSPTDLRKVLPIALAEHYVTLTQEMDKTLHVEVVSDLAKYTSGGQFNSQVEVVAPRRSLVKLAGRLSVLVEGKKSNRSALLLDVEGYDAGSLYHGSDPNSPHLITLFVKRGDGSRDKADYVPASNPSLWNRSGGVKSRMYIPAGRLRNTLSFTVTGFMSEEVYAQIMKEYERAFEHRSHM